MVRSKSCCLCCAPAPSEAHHFAGARGTSLKASDAFTVPLCRVCHNNCHQQGQAKVITKLWQACAMLLAERVSR